MRVIDLSMPIADDHFRWPVSREVKGDFEAGDLFQATRINVPCHGFTHMDAPCHMVPGGPTLDDLALDRVVGACAVIDLEGIAPSTEVTADLLAERAGHVRKGDIVLMRSCWERQRSITQPEFWTDAPYMSREASTWLLDRGVTAIAFDFPQDYTIRLLLSGEVRPIEEHVTHDVLLRNGVTLIEYVCNTAAVTTARTFLCALPIKVPGSDGAPARVVALEGVAAVQ